MKITVYENFPDCAKEIRETVFIKEQGFQNELDETDHEAAHLVAFDENNVPVATCRIFWNTAMNAYTLGRLAVIREYRGQHIGSALLAEAENYVREKGGKTLILHSQCQAAGFYKKSGYAEFGEIEDDEGCPHIWMRKSV
ncbi:MAG: GNAT family N-acetyltransferase [Roseburia sp.]|nr:GNAT family N-acetyltransferase [Ruminococcus sp.]MCM1153780.1 GNAT family N-acetyltransferase [Roseburia sp.]MCM1243134.1 GNAT family N-acetyltransferase [Roseburia sp.]